MRFRFLAPAAMACALAIVVPTYAPDAEGAIVERVVAVVGDQPILLTELRQRARPFLIKIVQGVPAAQQKVAEAEMYKELLGKLVDERVVSIAADKLNVTVSTKEVDDAIKLKAVDLKVSVGELVGEAAKQGLSEADYREEVRRELLFGKMLETRVRSRVRVTDDDARTYFHRLEVQERRNQNYHAAIITLPTEKRALADKIVKAARNGADFGALAKEHSTDASRSIGGDVGNKSPNAFGKPLDEAILHLAQGEISEPIFAGSRLVIVKIIERAPSSLPKYAEVKDIVLNRVREEMLQKQIKVWLDELKTGVYIDIRL